MERKGKGKEREGKGKGLEKIGEIYAQFTEKNKDNLVKTAKNLLKVQKADRSLFVDVSAPQNESLPTLLVLLTSLLQNP